MFGILTYMYRDYSLESKCRREYQNIVAYWKVNVMDEIYIHILKRDCVHCWLFIPLVISCGPSKSLTQFMQFVRLSIAWQSVYRNNAWVLIQFFFSVKVYRIGELQHSWSHSRSFQRARMGLVFINKQSFSS